MKRFIIIPLLLIAMFCRGQISIQLPKNLVTEQRMKSYVDSILSKKTDNGTPTKPVTPTEPETPANGLKPCKEGLTLLSVFETTSTSTKAQFHAVDVYGIDFEVINSAGNLVSGGQISPTSNVIAIPYTKQPAGTYTLKLKGNTCSAESSKQFTISGETGSIEIPGIKPDFKNLRHEIILDLTGRGFSNSTETGMEAEFAGYIEKFKFSWGWGISGVRVLVRWYDWEPTEGAYQVEALKRVIEWHRKRGLSLSVAFWPLRKGNDPLLTSVPIFNDGSPFYVVDINIGTKENPDYRYGESSPAYTDQIANARIFKSVKKLSEILYTYENAGYLALAGGATEEMNWPYRDGRLTDFGKENLSSFRNWCKVRGIPYNLPTVSSGNGVAWYNKDETGKEFLRHNTYVARKYFDNFVNAVHSGNASGRACYFMPAVASPAHAWSQDGFVQYTAANADEIYQSDGDKTYELYRKVRGVNILLPTLKIPVDCEFDRDDLGYGNKGFDGNLLGTFGDKAFSRGGRVVHLAMHFDDHEIQGMESSFKSLMPKWHNKPYVFPDVSGAEVVDITDSFWSNQWFSGTDLEKYYKEVAPNFWGSKGEPNLSL